MKQKFKRIPREKKKRIKGRRKRKKMEPIWEWYWNPWIGWIRASWRWQRYSSGDWKGCAGGQVCPIEIIRWVELARVVLKCYKNFKNPSPIQAHVWPFLLNGRDVIGIAKTGLGRFFNCRESKIKLNKIFGLWLFFPFRQDIGVWDICNYACLNKTIVWLHVEKLMNFWMPIVNAVNSYWIGFWVREQTQLHINLKLRKKNYFLVLKVWHN